MATKTTEEWEEMMKNPDPRVKWAMDIFDQEGEEFTSVQSRIAMATAAGGMPIGAALTRNAINRTPLRTNMAFAILTIPVFLWINNQWMDWNTRRATEDDAVMKHYILTNPERFPEPKRSKYIDKINEWVPIRF